VTIKVTVNGSFKKGVANHIPAKSGTILRADSYILWRNIHSIAKRIPANAQAILGAGGCILSTKITADCIRAYRAILWTGGCILSTKSTADCIRAYRTILWTGKDILWRKTIRGIANPVWANALTILGAVRWILSVIIIAQ